MILEGDIYITAKSLILPISRKDIACEIFLKNDNLATYRSKTSSITILIGI